MGVFYLLATCLGCLVGASEIVSRYRDAPDRALRTSSAWLYIALNGVASLAAFALVRDLPALQGIGGTTDGPGKWLIQALAAGISAMALFRSSLFMVRVGNTDIGIGPAAFLQILLAATDRATDRARAKPRAAAVQKIMGGISFALAKEALPSLCFGLMQGLTPEEQVTFGVTVKALESSSMEDAFKANSLGLSLMNLVGEDVLSQAVTMLRADITAKPKPIVQSIMTLKLLQTIDFSASRQTLLDGCLFVANKMADPDLTRRLYEEGEKIGVLRVSERQKVLILSSVLIDRFGEETVQYVLKCLDQFAAADKRSTSDSLLSNSEPAAQSGGQGRLDDNVVTLSPPTSPP